MKPLWADALADCGTVKENIAEIDRRDDELAKPDS